MNLAPSRRKILLAALFMLCIILLAALAISLLTTPTPRITTNFNLTVSGDQVLITHTGGESLDCGHLAVLLDDVTFYLPGEGTIDCPWSIGETLIIPYTPSYSGREIRITYDAGKGPQELMVAEIPGRGEEPGVPATPTVLPTTLPVTPTPTPTPTPTTTPGLPVSSFNATPRSGPVPLTVRFTDTSTGIPEEWLWTFGDGATSPLQNPVHTYTEVGSYQVGLAVKNEFGGHTRISQGYITVTPAEERSLYLEAQRSAIVSPGGFLEFSVTKPGARVKIGGQTLDMPPGSHVRLTIDEGGKGKISLRDGTIVLFFFDEVILSINGTESARGTVQDIVVPGYDSLVSSINLAIDGGKGDVRVFESGLPSPLFPGESPLFLSSLRPDPSGALTLDCYRENTTVFRGAVTSYRVE
jgi:PKD repeat protein